MPLHVTLLPFFRLVTGFVLPPRRQEVVARHHLLARFGFQFAPCFFGDAAALLTGLLIFLVARPGQKTLIDFSLPLGLT